MITIDTNWLLTTKFKWMAYNCRLCNHYYANKTKSLIIHTQMHTNSSVLRPGAVSCTSSDTVGYDTSALSIMHASADAQHINKVSFVHKCPRLLQFYLHRHIPNFYHSYTLYIYSTYVHSASSVLHIHLSFTHFTYLPTACTQCICTRPWNNEMFAWNLHK